MQLRSIPRYQMRNLFSIGVGVFLILMTSLSLEAQVINVDSQLSFDRALDNASADDTIVWLTGTYEDIFMDIREDRLYIRAESPGSVVFTGASRVDIRSDYITLDGFQFLGGDIDDRCVINTRGSFNIFTQLNIKDYTSYKYLRVREESRFVEITYCNFENRINLDDQNILSILVDENNPGFHKIQHCSFKNFDGTGNDLGIEPIRIGVSTQADFNSRTLVEFCYFTQCNGDGELISSKAGQNVYRFNTFENNPLSELVLRHGSEAIVYGNFFINGKGGVRVREGQDHYIYNNYFYGLDDRTIFLQNEDDDPLDNINIAFNTIISSAEVILGGSGSDRPTNVTFANNIFSDPDDDSFEDPTGTETWIGNMVFGDLGIPLPDEGLAIIDLNLEENSAGFIGLSENSPAIDAAIAGFAELPQFEGMDTIDTAVLFDLMGQSRPTQIEERDLGANEFPHEILIQPLATEENTGPTYLQAITTSVQNNIVIVENLFEVNPNPIVNNLNLMISSEAQNNLTIDLFNSTGIKLKSLVSSSDIRGQRIITTDISNLPAGIYTVRAISEERSDGKRLVQTIRFVKSK